MRETTLWVQLDSRPLLTQFLPMLIAVRALSLQLVDFVNICSVHRHCTHQRYAGLPSTLVPSTLAGSAPQQHSAKCDIEMEGGSVSHVVTLLNRICDEMGGMVGPSHTLHKHTIRCSPALF